MLVRLQLSRLCAHPLRLEFFWFIPCVGRNLDLTQGRRVGTRKRRTEDNLPVALHPFGDSDCRSLVFAVGSLGRSQERRTREKRLVLHPGECFRRIRAAL
jgi:hypothetical protein